MDYPNDRHEALQQFAALAHSNPTINTREQYDEFLQNVLGFTERNREYTADLSDIDKLAYLKEVEVSLDAIQAKLTEAEARLGNAPAATQQKQSATSGKHKPVPVTVHHFASNTPSDITDEFLATLKNMPERFATTELFQETFARWENQKAEFLALSDAGHMDAMDGDPRCDEVIALMPTMQRKLKQYDRDFAQAKTNLVRRTAWDAVLLKRIFNFFK